MNYNNHIKYFKKMENNQHILTPCGHLRKKNDYCEDCGTLLYKEVNNIKLI